MTIDCSGCSEESSSIWREEIHLGSVVCSIDDVDDPGEVSVLWEGKASTWVSDGRYVVTALVFVLVVLG